MNTTNAAGCTALYYACSHGYLQVARELLAHGARTDVGDYKPLTGAAAAGHRDITEWLLTMGRKYFGK